MGTNGTLIGTPRIYNLTLILLCPSTWQQSFFSGGRGLCFMHVIGTNKNEGEDLLLLIVTLTRTCTNVSCRILQ